MLPVGRYLTEINTQISQSTANMSLSNYYKHSIADECDFVDFMIFKIYTKFYP